jgi:sulfatase modifying factor 1
VTQPSAATSALLGSPELCGKYSGLPDNWGSDSRAGMVHLSGGDFTLGTTFGYEEERQEIKTQVKDFWIDQTEVTVAQFAAFVKATGYITEAEREGGAVVFRTPSAEELNQRSYAWWGYLKGADWRHPAGSDSSPINNHPVTLITLTDALTYAKWLGRDLPTDAEWEYAAKAGYPQGANLEKEPRNAKGKPLANFWQGEFPSQNTGEDGHEGLAPVGCYIANDFKLYDMLGNAWEQTKDIYTESHRLHPNQDLAASPAKPNQPMVIKGGSHLCGRDFCVRYRPSAREAHEANLPVSHIGFRTIIRDNEPNPLPDFEAW